MQIDSVPPNETPDLPEISEDQPPIAPTPFPDSLSRIFRNHPNLQFEIKTGFQGGPGRRRKGYQLALWSLTASVIDTLLLLGMGCIFLLVFLKIVRMPITADLLKDFGTVFVCGLWMYMVTTRFFIGASVGEAACDLRLGRPQDRLSPKYFARVLFRASLICATGVVVLPVLSLIFGQDVAGKLSGVSLFSLK